jgi:hypothetical protein
MEGKQSPSAFEATGKLCQFGHHDRGEMHQPRPPVLAVDQPGGCGFQIDVSLVEPQRLAHPQPV